MWRWVMALSAVGFSIGCQATTSASSDPGARNGSSWRVACPAPRDGGVERPLTFSLQHTRRESSRDSHSTRLRAEFNGQILTLYGPYGTCTRGICEHREVAFVPTDNEVAEIRDLLESQDLWTPHHELANTDFRGPDVGSTHVTKVSLQLTDEARSAQSTVTFGEAHGRETQRTGSDAARQKAQAVRRVLMALRKMALRCFPDFQTG